MSLIRLTALLTIVIPFFNFFFFSFLSIFSPLPWGGAGGGSHLSGRLERLYQLYTVQGASISVQGVTADSTHPISTPPSSVILKM